MTDNPRTSRDVFVDAVRDNLNGTPNASHPVQFEPSRVSLRLMRCTLCHAVVEANDADDHRHWHDCHVKEHDRIMEQARRHVPEPRYC